jgi:DNA-binding NarL/FixJ family response regulator
MPPHIPIRVFLLSSTRLLSEALDRVLRKTADILVVRARQYSVDAPVEIIESTCDVLLTDSVSMLALDSQIADDLRCSLSQLKVVMIEWDDDESTSSKLQRLRVTRNVSKESAVTDVISAIRSVAKGVVVKPALILYDAVPKRG